MEMVLGIFMMFCSNTDYPASCRYDLDKCVAKNYNQMDCASEDMTSCVFQQCYDKYFFRYFDQND